MLCVHVLRADTVVLKGIEPSFKAPTLAQITPTNLNYLGEQSSVGYDAIKDKQKVNNPSKLLGRHSLFYLLKTLQNLKVLRELCQIMDFVSLL